LPLRKGYGKLAAAFSTEFRRVRKPSASLALLPLPLCIALSLQAQAAESAPDWGLCPIEDAVPAFATTTAEGITPELRAQMPTDILGDSVTGAEGQSTTFSGNVSLARGDQMLETDNLTFDSATNRYSATGNVRYQDSGMRLVAESAEGDQEADSHNVRNVRYQLTERRGNGGAEQIQLQGTQGSMYDSTYSTCPPSQRMWELQADRIDVDTAEGTGVARNAVLRVGKVPVLYVPYMPFPLDNRRRTGLLYPSIGLNDRNGFDWRQPIYFNLAPNYDDTLTPRLMTNRGLMLSNEFRYLTPTGKGDLDLSYLPSDGLTDEKRDVELADFIENGYDLDNRRKEDRGQFRFKGFQNVGDTWQARANLNWISDPRYVEDFSNSLGGITPFSIKSDIGLYGRGRYWNGGLMADHLQLSDYTLREYQLRYDRLPRAFFNWEQSFDRWLTAGVNAEAVRFQHIDDASSVTRTLADGTTFSYPYRAGGSRIDIKPFVSLSMGGTSWFVRPTLAWRYTGYNLSEGMTDSVAYNRALASVGGRASLVTEAGIESFRDDAPTRNMPIASLDAGLFFDRETSIGGTSFLQTLEPRLYYLNVPYRNQDALPRFDTGAMTFSWGQLFRDNRFTGPDRQTDANQVTVALTSRLIREADGREKLSASIGQIRYLDDSRVGLAIDPVGIQSGKSAWVADANYAVNDRWNIGASYQWDPQFSRSNLTSIRTRYLIGDEGVVNLGYRYRRRPGSDADLLEQADLSFLYPLTPAWSVVGRYYYSLLDAGRQRPKLLEGIIGVQWDSCCMAARLMARRYLRNRTGELNDAIQFELEFKGLGSAGPDTTSRLRRAILGYEREDLYLVPPPEVRTGDDEDDDGLQDPTSL
jgi:LPS-assembly protein